MNYREKYLKYKLKYNNLKNINQKGGKDNVIYHIIGASGAGKTSLGNKLSKLDNVIVIDTDDIEDKHKIEFYNDKRNYEKITNLRNIKNEDGTYNMEEIDKQWHELESEIKRKKIIDLQEILDENSDKHIILVGHTMDPPSGYTIKGYSIDIDADTLYKQLNLRTLKSIKENIDEITQLLNNDDIPMEIKDTLLNYKYKIRVQFPKYTYKVLEALPKRNKKAIDKGYKILSRDEIYEEIKSLII
jgi:tRNA A37 N6-isopentenylltransferase MiaA